MFAAVNESAKMLTPLSISISNGILRSIEFMLKALPSEESDKRKIKELAHSLKFEYPHESLDYVTNMAANIYKAGRK